MSERKKKIESRIDDLFKESAKSFIKENSVSMDEIVAKTEEIIDEQRVENNKKIASEYEKTDWERLAEAMENQYAKKFMTILDTLSDKEFVRCYLKALEFFKPKMIRQDARPGDDGNNVLNVVLNIRNDEGEIETIDLNLLSEEITADGKKIESYGKED